MDEEHNGGVGSSSSHGLVPRLYDVGRDAPVLGVHSDPVGLIGCQLMVPWPVKASLCYVDAYAPDAPDGPAYVVSWVSKCDEHHLLPCATA